MDGGVRATVTGMLQDRGYTGITRAHVGESYVPETTQRGVAYANITANRPDGQPVLVFSCLPPFGVAKLRAYVTAAAAVGCEHVIVVGPPPSTDVSKEPVAIRVEMFRSAFLKRNMQRHHVQVVKHRVLTEAEVARLLNKFKATLEGLPRLSKGDAMSRYYDWEVGTVVGFVRVRMGAQPELYFRCVHEKCCP